MRRGRRRAVTLVATLHATVLRYSAVHREVETGVAEPAATAPHCARSLNEVCNGINLKGEFDTRMGCPVEDARELLVKIHALASTQ
jgi:hypothetical protein